MFGADQFSPGTSNGAQLLAHELTHVVQYRTAPSLLSGVIQRDAAANTDRPAPTDPRADPNRLSRAYLHWKRTGEIAPEDLKAYAAVEIVTGHWELLSDRYDMFMAAFHRGPRVIQLDDLPPESRDRAVAYYFLPGEFSAEHSRRLDNAYARMRACGHGSSAADIECQNAVWADVAPTKFAQKQAGRAYFRRGMAAAEGAMEGGNPLEMGALVFAHNVLGWSPERAAAFGSLFAGVASLSGLTAARTMAVGRQREQLTSLEAEGHAPAADGPHPSDPNAGVGAPRQGQDANPRPDQPTEAPEPRPPAALIAGLGQPPRIETQAPAAKRAPTAPVAEAGQQLPAPSPAVLGAPVTQQPVKPPGDRERPSKSPAESREEWRAPRPGETPAEWAARTTADWNDLPEPVRRGIIRGAPSEMRTASLKVIVRDPHALWQHYLTEGGYQEIMQTASLRAGAGVGNLGGAPAVRAHPVVENASPPNRTTIDFEVPNASVRPDVRSYMAGDYVAWAMPAGDLLPIKIVRVRYANGAVATLNPQASREHAWRLRFGNMDKTMSLSELLGLGERPTIP